MLRIITGIETLVIDREQYETQYDAVSLDKSKSCIFDVHAGDIEGRKYDLEVERWDATSERAEVHVAQMVFEHLRAGGEPKDLLEIYVIFMCESDKRHNGRAINQYSYCNEDRFIEDDLDIEKKIAPHASMGGKTHILYVNGKYNKKNNEIGKLIHDFNCSNANDMYIKELSDRMRSIKTSEKEVNEMSQLIENEKKKSKEEGKIIGAVETMREFGMTEGGILERIKEKFGLNDTEATGIISKVPMPA